MLSNDRSTVMSGGFDAAAGYNLGSAKREPSMLRIKGTGSYNITLPCKVPRAAPTAAQIASGDIYYCNG